MNPTKKAIIQMTAAEREADVRRDDKGVDLAKTRPLSAKGRLLWERAKRGGGSPKLRAILSASRQRLRAGTGIAHDDFWREVEPAPPVPRGRKRVRG